MPEKYNFIKKALLGRSQNQQLRAVRSVVPMEGALIKVNGRNLINFSSNDYLGLSQNKLIAERAIEYIQKYGAGATASRLVCGNLSVYGVIEKKLATLKGTENALLFSSGFQLNVSLLPALADRNTLILADRLAHNSIIQGALLSRCTLLRYRHNDLKHLRSLLTEKKGKHSRVIIVTESVFSMDGDCTDIAAISAISQENNAILIVDEAHATGVLGEKGMGLTCGHEVDIVMGTFGKGCGSFGAYIASNTDICQYLVNFCNGLIYTTALPPAVLGAVNAALEIIPTMDKERRNLMQMADYLRDSLAKIGFSCGASTTQIVPVIVGSDERCVELGRWLEKSGFLAVGIRPPTVEKGRARIRIALSVLHTQKQVDDLLHAFKTWQQ